jgi:tetratricopeptide (TPR) repeat protein
MEMIPRPAKIKETAAVSFLLVLAISPLTGNDDQVTRLSIEAWNSVLMLNYRPAEKIFRGIAENQPEFARDATFSRAAVLLSFQPRTNRNVERAYTLFEQVALENPDDELGLEARYFLARIHHVHAFSPDFKEAERRYRKLMQAAPDTFPGQLASTKLAILRLFRVDRPDQRIESIDEFAPISRHLSHPGLRLSLHMTLADALQIYELDDERAFHHLSEAYVVCSPTFGVHAQLLIRLSQLALTLGKKELAETYLEEFLRRYPRSNRANYMAIQLDQIRSGS